ncbi:MAG: cell division protein FtsQ/DivIB [Candidatus Omnitrophota bacterium]|nr:cell division protein FtsQ/DivIB [Candidatus Omnitrophota bacterium]
MRKKRFNLPVKTAVIILAVLLVFAFTIGYSAKFLLNADYFRIKDVIARGADAAGLSYLKGKNIFSLDMEKESLYLMDSFPDASGIRIVRLLPNRVFVDFVKRRPVALIKIYRYFALDSEGVIFYAPDDAHAQAALPVITGLETKIFGPKPGNRYNTREIRLSLEIIREFKSSRLLRNYILKRIDAASFSSAAIFISSPLNALTGKRALENLEIKLGPSGIREKTAILGGLLQQEKGAIANIKYIDLRFKEPVIKYNNAK